MRWRRRAPRPTEDAKAAVEQARRAHWDAARQTDYAGQVADMSARIREVNHFAAAITKAIRGGAS